MEGSTETTVTSPNSSSSNSSAAPQSPAAVVISPCAACKILRRRCIEKCVLAPYFPPTEPLKFTTAHRVFGASNIIKFLQELPEPQRADAVSSMVYEANARLRDPVYGCAGAICQLQKQVNELQEQLAKAKAEIVNVQCQNANLMALIYMEMSHQPSSSQTIISPHDQHSSDNFFANYSPRGYLSNASFLDENNNLSGLLCEQSLWA